jgi:hypothetical protein
VKGTPADYIFMRERYPRPRLWNYIACSFFHSRAVHLDIIRVFYLPTYAQECCFKNIKIYIKTAPTYFGLIAINQGAHYLSLAKVTFIKIIKICRSCFNVNFNIFKATLLWISW